VYRTPQQKADTSPGATYYLCDSRTLTAADVAAQGIYNTRNTTPDSGLSSAELYTNPGQTGPNSYKQPPPLAAWMAVFKGYTFFGNRTDIATKALAVPGGMSTSISALPATNAYARKIGLGWRTFTATFTATSNVLTAISAADIVGLAVGQRIADASLVGGTGTVTAVGATTLTLSTTANANITKTTSTSDVVLVNGIEAAFTGWGQFVSNLYVRGLVGVLAQGIDPPVNQLGTVYGDGDYSARNFVITAQMVGVSSFTLAASNPQNYVPPLPATTATALTVSTTPVLNGIAWSEQNQPEAVPPLNIATIGSGTLYGGWATRDALWIFASDGLWRLTGTGGAAGRGFDWTWDQLDSTLSLSAPHAACVKNDLVYAYTNRGLVEIGPRGIRELSQGRINDLLPGPPFSLTNGIQVVADETNDEIIVAASSTSSPFYYVYNTLSDAWTTNDGGVTGTPTVYGYSRFLQSPMSMDSFQAYSAVPDGIYVTVQLYGSVMADYQPVSGGSPMVGGGPSELKEWIDGTWIFDSGVATFPTPSTSLYITPRWNGVDYSSAQRQTATQVNDARASWSVPRNAPRISNSLAPGIRIVGISSAQLPIFGVTLRSVPLTNQRKQR
jgi:hypothetical protein